MAALPVRVPVWPARLIQILFAAIYFGSAITKVQTPEFFSGEQMRYWLVSNWNWPNPIGEMMALSPAVLMISSYITVVWEVTFPFLVWRPLGRFAALGLGVVFHLMTIFSLGLWIFPFICTMCYLAFLNEGDIAAIRVLLGRLRLAWLG
ncbi:MAG: HTTM domain-containing protein, partial [Planctomycetaceae bacterium]